MAWIKAEYADEFAVVTTWLAAVLPWSVAYTTEAPAQSWVFFFRFPIAGLQFRMPTEINVGDQVVDAGVPELLADAYGGIGLFGNLHLQVPPLQIGASDGALLAAHALWTLAAVITFIAVVLSVAMYRREDAVRARLPMGYAKLTSIVFGVLALLLAGATAAFAMADAPYGTPVPLGVVIVTAFAVVLWRAERVPASGEAGD